MPWAADSFRKRHNKKLSPTRARKAAKIANAILRKTGDEAKAIRIANSQVAAIAADKWWDGLSDTEKKTYIRAHPHSKYAGEPTRVIKLSNKTRTVNLHADDIPAKHFFDDIDATTYPNPFDPRHNVLGEHGQFQVSRDIDSPHDTVRIDDIRSFAPRSGGGHAILRHLTDLADKHGVHLSLTAKAYDKNKKVKTKDLVDWYARNGFKKLGGDMRDGYDMVRTHVPKSEKASASKVIIVETRPHRKDSRPSYRIE